MNNKISRFPMLGVTAVAMVADSHELPPTASAQDGLSPSDARPGRKRTLRRAAVISLFVGFALPASAAALQNNGDYLGGRLIYDPNTDLTWYQAPYATANWSDAMAWAASLNVAGATGWRLPSAAPATVIDNGLQMIVTGNPDDGELAHLWYDQLGNHAGAMTNSGPFDPTPWQPPYNTAYWTSSGPWYGHLTGYAVEFSVHDGNYGLVVIPPWTPAFGAEIAVCAGNVGPAGRLASPVRPRLNIARSGNSLILSWPSLPSGFKLQQCSDPAAGSWSPSGLAVSDDGTNCSATLSAPTGILFFRLTK